MFFKNSFFYKNKAIFIFLFLVVFGVVGIYLFKFFYHQNFVVYNLTRDKSPELNTSPENSNPLKKKITDISEGENKSEQQEKNEQKKNKYQPQVLYKRQKLSFLKFVSSENCIYDLSESEVKKLKNLHINGIRICPGYIISPERKIIEDIPESFIIKLIRKAHQNNWAVFLELNLAQPPSGGEFGGFPNISNIDELNKLYQVSLKWAKIAQKENVEFYSPLNEPNMVFVDGDLLATWVSKSQELKKVFAGELVLKFSGTGPEALGNIKDYGWLAFDVMWADNNLYELENYLKFVVEKAEFWKKAYNLKGVFLGEIGAEKRMVSQKTQAVIFNEVLKETWGKLDGYCFLGWSNLEFSFKNNREAIKVISQWFSKK